MKKIETRSGWQRRTRLSRVVVLAILSSYCTSAPAQELDATKTSAFLATLQNLPAGDEASTAAVESAKQLQNSSVEVITVLKAMKEASPIGRNWLSGVANTIKMRSAKLDIAALEEFLSDSNQDGEARYMVFQWLTENDDAKRSSLLEKFLEDPSPELRFAAIEQQFTPFKSGEPKDKPAVITDLSKMLEVARHPNQVMAIIDRSNELGTAIVAADHFGFIRNWKTIGPFDNTNQGGFNVEYDVEKNFAAGKLDLSQSHKGKADAEVAWKDAIGNDREGVVDLAELYNKEKGAVVYAYATFNSPIDQPGEIRAGSINATKVWLNGEPLISEEVYHSSMQIDQYNAKVNLKKGENKILFKCCQNEQTESWAQLYVFQVRVCDSTGKALEQAK